MLDHQQQQQLQLQQQQIYQKQQQVIQQNYHIYQTQQQVQQIQQQQQHMQQNVHPQYQQQQQQMPPHTMGMASMTTSVHQQQQIYPPPPNYHSHQHRHSDVTSHSTAGILINKSSQSHQTQAPTTRQSNTVTFAKDTMDAPSSANTNDTYDRKEHLYKCSTLRHGGKFDKPSIQNCPLPAIPTTTDMNHQQQQAPATTQTQTIQIKKEGGKEGIYSSRVLPQNRKIPTGKAVPLPKIGSFDKPSNNLSTFASPPPPANTATTAGGQTSIVNNDTYASSKRDQSLPPPPTASELKQQMQQMQQQSAQHLQNQQQGNTNADGSEFYAVTEL